MEAKKDQEFSVEISTVEMTVEISLVEVLDNSRWADLKDIITIYSAEVLLS